MTSTDAAGSRAATGSAHTGSASTGSALTSSALTGSASTGAASTRAAGPSSDGCGSGVIKVVAFGGGHGLAGSLRALLTSSLDLDITAVVTVGDNGGSSGRLRVERDAQLPPGDLRMALAALADDDPTHQRTVALMQHRFELVGKPGDAQPGSLRRRSADVHTAGLKPGRA
ncbi:MAG: hypothetical protein QOE51_1080, partial [Actinoplanes sp.]|nr:hypothetical protein [Actinoplanes sp.]